MFFLTFLLPNAGRDCITTLVYIIFTFPYQWHCMFGKARFEIKMCVGNEKREWEIE